jgi:hypothetical protein
MIFRRKEKEFKKELENYQEAFSEIEEKLYEIVYYNNENVTQVQAGKIPLQQGWVIRHHGEHLSNVQVNRIVYPNYEIAFKELRIR